MQLTSPLIPKFDSPFGLPTYGVNFSNLIMVLYGNTVLLAEIGTIQSEFSRLTHITGNDLYREKAYQVYDHLDKLKKDSC